MECAKTMSRKEIQSKFNVPGPTIRFSIIGSKISLHILIRMWVLQAQGLPYLKRVTKTKFEGSLKDFLLASGKQLDIKSNPSKKIKSEPPKILQANQRHQMKGQMMLVAWDRSMLNS